MARPIKTGFDYFPLDVDIFDDDKVRFVSARFQEKGELVIIKLLCKIFKNGYYIDWNEDMALLFASTAGKNLSNGLVNDIVHELIRRGFFDKNLFERFSILTSNGIQKRYKNICQSARRKSPFFDSKYEIKEFPPELTPLIPEETQVNSVKSTQSKVKEIKEKKSIDVGEKSPTNRQRISLEERKKNFQADIAQHKDKYDRQDLVDFYNYWVETNATTQKMKWEMQKTWETNRRIKTWVMNKSKFQKH